MDTVRVDICYRPLRIGWAIAADDFQAFRAAVRLSYTLWGGRFNPIIVVDRQDEADRLVDLFRLDVILPIGTSEAVQSFPKRFPYLIKPFFQDTVCVDNGDGTSRSQILDIHNALIRAREMPEWRNAEENFRIYKWEPDDPLAEMFLIQFGDYPSKDECNIDYMALVKEALEPKETKIDPAATLPSDIFDHPSISFISRLGLDRHYGISKGWDSPGFYCGDVTNLDDLICFWNIRAADIPLFFVDQAHFDRYGGAIPIWTEKMRKAVSRRRHEFDRRLAVWTRREIDSTEGARELLKPFGDAPLGIARISQYLWSGGSVNVPMMHFAQVSTMGVMDSNSGKPKVSFALDKKPFCDDAWFHTQQLVISLSFIGGLYGDEQHTLIPPFIPELNEFYARAMHFEYNKVRSEPERIGVVIDATETSSFIYALPISDLFNRVLVLAGFSSKLSSGGLIARQLIAQLGGLNGARVFKIAGVRRLLKSHGPTAVFTKKKAVELIGSKDPANPGTSFKEYDGFYLAPRPDGTKLRPGDAFTYLVEKGLFRIGAELSCPNCRMSSWTALDSLSQRVVCELCGLPFDATRQLVDGTWHYRRSGVLGAERNAQGSVPVVLTLQQFDKNLASGLRDGMYSPSLDLKPLQGFDLPECEIDFMWLSPAPYPRKTAVLIGECKDRGGGGIKDTIDKTDIEHLNCIANTFPKKRFEAFIVLVKLCPFTAEEIALAKTLNDKSRQRVILLTDQELEPNRFYDRTRLVLSNIKPDASEAADLAAATAQIYFQDVKP
jgi:hypothetical protein